MLKWEQGRQESGYFKMKLLESKRFRFDCYLLKFEHGVHVPWHKDPVEGGKHFRLNIYLRKPARGGGSVIAVDRMILETSRFHLFRPDINEHAMSTVNGGPVYMLSIGKIW